MIVLLVIAGVLLLLLLLLLIPLGLEAEYRQGFTLRLRYLWFTIPLLPNFVGWIFLWRGVDALAPVRPSLDLLKPFCTALGV